MESKINPEGTVSVTVTAPAVGTALKAFETVTEYGAFGWPWRKLPPCVFMMLRTGILEGPGQLLTMFAALRVPMPVAKSHPVVAAYAEPKLLSEVESTPTLAPAR